MLGKCFLYGILSLLWGKVDYSQECCCLLFLPSLELEICFSPGWHQMLEVVNWGWYISSWKWRGGHVLARASTGGTLQLWGSSYPKPSFPVLHRDCHGFFTPATERQPAGRWMDGQTAAVVRIPMPVGGTEVLADNGKHDLAPMFS